MMHRRVRPVVALVGIITILGTARAVPAWAGDVGVDFWNLPKVEADRENADERRKELFAKQDYLWRLFQINDHIIDQLVYGELSLAEAASRLAELNRDRCGVLTNLREMYPQAVSEHELFARNAIARVEYALQHNPSRAIEVSSRLDAELRAMIL